MYHFFPWCAENWEKFRPRLCPDVEDVRFIVEAAGRKSEEGTNV